MSKTFAMIRLGRFSGSVVRTLHEGDLPVVTGQNQDLQKLQEAVYDNA